MKKLDPKKDWYNEYKRLGGKKSKKQFLKNVNIFMDHTFDIFIHGDPEKYKTRRAALMGAKQAANIDKKELDFNKKKDFCSVCGSKLGFIRYNPKNHWKIKGQLCKACWDTQKSQLDQK